MAEVTENTGKKGNGLFIGIILLLLVGMAVIRVRGSETAQMPDRSDGPDGDKTARHGLLGAAQLSAQRLKRLLRIRSGWLPMGLVHQSPVGVRFSADHRQ